MAKNHSDQAPIIRLGISACLLGQPVRHGAGLRSGRILLVGNFGTTEAPVDESRMVPTGQISPYGFPVVAQHGRRLSHGECRALLSDDNGESWRTSVAIDVMDYCAGGCFTELSDDTVLLPVYGYRQGASEGEHCSNGFVCSTAGSETWRARTTRRARCCAHCTRWSCWRATEAIPSER